jgi:hypothetical protein
MQSIEDEFQRTNRGLNILSNGLQQTGQNRLHQLVRSLEALILPDVGKTEKQFAHRCQTFARAGDETRALLLEAFAMRSDTEHVHSWDEAVQGYPADQRANVCWQRTRQIEHLACDAYHGYCVMLRSGITSGQMTRSPLSGRCRTTSGASCGVNPLISRTNLSFKTTMAGEGLCMKTDVIPSPCPRCISRPAVRANAESGQARAQILHHPDQ